MQRKPITAQDILNNPGIILAIAAILLIIGTIGPWVSVSVPGFATITTSGLSTGGGRLALIYALIMLGTAAVSLGYIRSPTLGMVFPILSVSTLTGFGATVGGLLGLTTGAAGWGLIVVIFAGLVALFAAYRAFIQKTRAGL